MDYETQPRTIGKHEWRAVVTTRNGNRILTYEWRRLPCSLTGWSDRWRDYHEWPGYDFNDGSYAGCPRSLAKVYETNKTAIKAAMGNR
jgi:hypothetical protein